MLSSQPNGGQCVGYGRQCNQHMIHWKVEAISEIRVASTFNFHKPQAVVRSCSGANFKAQSIDETC